VSAGVAGGEVAKGVRDDAAAVGAGATAGQVVAADSSGRDGSPVTALGASLGRGPEAAAGCRSQGRIYDSQLR